MKYEISNIDASLAYGRLINSKSKRLAAVYFGIIAGLLLPVLTLIIIVITLTVEMDWNSDETFALISGNIFSLFLLGASLGIFFCNNNHKKKIILWLEDAIKTKAKIHRLYGLEYKPYQIQVDFKIDDKQYRKISAPGNIFTGYRRVFTKFADRQINILYTPKYDQVLLLKEDS